MLHHLHSLLPEELWNNSSLKSLRVKRAAARNTFQFFLLFFIWSRSFFNYTTVNFPSFDILYFYSRYILCFCFLNLSNFSLYWNISCGTFKEPVVFPVWYYKDPDNYVSGLSFYDMLCRALGVVTYQQHLFTLCVKSYKTFFC